MQNTIAIICDCDGTLADDTTEFLLEENGFKNIKLYDWRETEHSQFDDHSQAYFPHLDKENGLLVSLNIECQKI